MSDQIMEMKQIIGLKNLAPKYATAQKKNSEPVMILERFDRQMLAKMEIALEQACDIVSIGGQKHGSRRYIAKQIIECISSGGRSLDSMTTAAVAAAEVLNARRRRNSAETKLSSPKDGSRRLKAPEESQRRAG